MKQITNLVIAVISLIFAYYFTYKGIYSYNLGYNQISQYYFIGSFICWSLSAFLISINYNPNRN
jgi:RsiW-degrading membrane proteinase PrsW (M82 family)